VTVIAGGKPAKKVDVHVFADHANAAVHEHKLSTTDVRSIIAARASGWSVGASGTDVHNSHRDRRTLAGIEGNTATSSHLL
jgi:hypothetical protein